ncbi:MAG TPA: sulfite exporter TauE/SafE family protein, partial [Candidatus Poseidoniales archaeon]|nr:sulfite exporter TauE/SafE family protein [Candidatus Poseidoniales archaeon]
MVTTEFGLILVGLFLVALLYSSVGHGGGSGYLAILSLTSYGTMEVGWLKQYAWCLNLIVAGIAFWHYSKAGHHVREMTVPLVGASVPFALIGGYLRVDGALYDTLLSVTLIWAAWRLLLIKRDFVGVGIGPPGLREALPVGGAIGLASGLIGVGGGIFLSPVVLLRRWATPKVAAATAAAFIWLNSAAGLAGAGLS